MTVLFAAGYDIDQLSAIKKQFSNRSTDYRLQQYGLKKMPPAEPGAIVIGECLFCLFLIRWRQIPFAHNACNSKIANIGKDNARPESAA
jgi:hypothetical protein